MKAEARLAGCEVLDGRGLNSVPSLIDSRVGPVGTEVPISRDHLEVEVVAETGNEVLDAPHRAPSTEAGQVEVSEHQDGRTTGHRTSIRLG